jgi:hypothetical protein
MRALPMLLSEPLIREVIAVLLRLMATLELGLTLEAHPPSASTTKPAVIRPVQ